MRVVEAGAVVRAARARAPARRIELARAAAARGGPGLEVSQNAGARRSRRCRATGRRWRRGGRTGRRADMPASGSAGPPSAGPPVPAAPSAPVCAAPAATRRERRERAPATRAVSRRRQQRRRRPRPVERCQERDEIGALALASARARAISLVPRVAAGAIAAAIEEGDHLIERGHLRRVHEARLLATCSAASACGTRPPAPGVTAAGSARRSPSLNAPRRVSGSASAAAMPSAAPRSFTSMNATATTRRRQADVVELRRRSGCGPPWQADAARRARRTARRRAARRASSAVASPSSQASKRPGPQRSWRT